MLNLHAGSLRPELTLPPGWQQQWVRHVQPPEVTQDITTLVSEALNTPIGSERLAKLAAGARTALLIVPDRTRPGPWGPVIEVVAVQLMAAGLAAADILVMVATGTHRPMTASELEEFFGKNVVDSYAVVNHDHTRTHELKDLGTTSNGTPIQVNRKAVDSDLVIGIGGVKPHRVAGWSGGAKLVQPGISSNATTAATHWLSARFPAPEITGNADNPVRREMEEVARRVGLDFTVNLVLDRTYKAIAVRAGHYIDAHRSAVDVARAVYEISVDRLADIIIAANPPQARNMWAIGSGPNEAELLVREGGAIVTLLDVPEGVAASHPEVEKWGYHRTYDQIADLVARGEIRNLNAAAHLEHAGGKLWRKGLTWFAWAPSLEDSLLERLGAVPCRTPQEAVDRAIGGRKSSPGHVTIIDGDEPWEFLVAPRSLKRMQQGEK